MALKPIPNNLLRSRNKIEQHEHEDAADARRVTFVTPTGGFIGHDPSAPLHVSLSDGNVSIGTVNAELEVQLSHINNSPDAGDVADSVQVGDGVETLAINPDGSINVNITKTNPAANTITTYNEVIAVAASTPTTVATYTAPIGKVSYLQRVEASGENIAEYEVKINGTTIKKKRTYFTEYDVDFEFLSGPGGNGKDLVAGDIVSVIVTHVRGAAANFNATIQSLEIT